MPDTIKAVASAIANWVGQAAINAGASTGVASFLSTAALVATEVAVTVGLNAAISGLLSDGLPSPDVNHENRRQSKGPREAGYGRYRTGGTLVCFEADTAQNDAYLITDLHFTRIHAITGYWLNDDKVTLNGSDYVVNRGDGGYGRDSDMVLVKHRLGLDTETAYSEAVAGIPDRWTTDHRGDRCASAMFRCHANGLEDFPSDYPNGRPTPTVELEAQLVHDPRDEAQDPDDRSTFAWSDNNALCLADFLTNPYTGLGEPWGETIDEAALTAAADACDDALTNADGATIKRYTAGGNYYLDGDPSVVVGNLLAGMDGWMTYGPAGKWIIKAGTWEAPTVTMGGDDIVGLYVEPYRPLEDTVNVLNVSFVSPLSDYNEVECDAWRDETSIELVGEKPRPLKLMWVQTTNQARRLAKIAMSRLRGRSGTCRVRMTGMAVFGERRITLDDPEVGSMVVEITSGPTLDFSTMTISFGWQEAFEDAYDFDAEAEEGTTPGGAVRPAPIEVVAPVLVFAEVQISGGVPRIKAEYAAAAAMDSAIRWRVAGGGGWTTSTFTSPAPDDDSVAGQYYQLTSSLPASTDIELQLQARSGGGRLSAWAPATPYVIDTGAAVTSPWLPLLDYVDTSTPGEATVAWTNNAEPAGITLAGARIWRGGSGDFGAAADVSGLIAGAAGDSDTWTDTGMSAGTYFYWLTTEDGGGVTSPYAGPVVAVVT